MGMLGGEAAGSRKVWVSDADTVVETGYHAWVWDADTVVCKVGAMPGCGKLTLWCGKWVPCLGVGC